jgi:hypothetical protein
MKNLLCLLSIFCLSGCLERIGQIDRNLKPYGAHWIKEGMTRESRVADWLQCGGGAYLNDGYERQSGITTKAYFEGLELHRKRIRSCMGGKKYFWIEQCDARCIHP